MPNKIIAFNFELTESCQWVSMSGLKMATCGFQQREVRDFQDFPTNRPNNNKKKNIEQNSEYHFF